GTEQQSRNPSVEPVVMQIPRPPQGNGNRQRHGEPSCSRLSQKDERGGPEQIEMLFDGQRPIVNRVPAPSPADPVSWQVVTKEEHGTPPLPGADDDEAAHRKSPDHDQVKQRGRENPASPPDVKASK